MVVPDRPDPNRPVLEDLVQVDHRHLVRRSVPRLATSRVFHLVPRLVRRNLRHVLRNPHRPRHLGRYPEGHLTSLAVEVCRGVLTPSAGLSSRSDRSVLRHSLADLDSTRTTRPWPRPSSGAKPDPKTRSKGTDRCPKGQVAGLALELGTPDRPLAVQNHCTNLAAALAPAKAPPESVPTAPADWQASSLRSVYVGG